MSSVAGSSRKSPKKDSFKGTGSLKKSPVPEILSGTKKRKTETVAASLFIETQLRVKLLSEFAVAPRRASAGAAGYDLTCSEECVIEPRSRGIVKTDIAIGLPEGTYGRVAPRSGLAVKSGIDVGAGVIDVDYRGPVQVLLFNFTDEPFKVNRGDRIAQLVLEVIRTPEVMIVSELHETERGEAGLGSTGVSDNAAGSSNENTDSNIQT